MGLLGGLWKGLRTASTIGSFIPGVNAVAIPVRAGIAAADAGKAISKGDYRSALFNAVQAYPGLSSLRAGKAAQAGGDAFKLSTSLPYPDMIKAGGLRGLMQGIPGPVRDIGLSALMQMGQGQQRRRRQAGRPQVPWFLKPTVRAANGAVAGIPRLPDDYQGYVNGPHLTSLGEDGPEVVVPLWKLMRQTRGY
tara:strand:- start:777 stop:1355 length:579 start_codon:yes stop_codon:yes gene_type:complete